MESGQNKQPKPNFLIVGAAKAGTTSLAKYLNEHPDIFIPEQKELRFFVKDALLNISDNDPLKKDILKSSILDENEYFKIYNVKEKMAGDASVHYLYHHEEAIPKIKSYLGDIPIIIMLRNPVDRAISHVKYLKTLHNSTIQDELNMENKRIDNNYNSFWFYKTLGFYSVQVEAYLSNFSNVKIILFEDFQKNTKESFEEVVDFLKLPPFTLEKFNIHNPSIEKRVLFKLITESGILKLFKPFIPKKGRESLKKFSVSSINYKRIELTLTQKEKNNFMEDYKKDIIKLEKLLQRNLSSWYDEL